MSRLRMSVAIFGAAAFLGLANLALANSDDEKNKDKPKDAAIFDDQTATLTETVDGKEKTKKIDLKHCLKVKGYFKDDGFHIEEVEAGGPATQLSTADGNNNGVSLEKGDIIKEVDGKPVKSAEDYAKAMNGVSDPSKTKLKVRDVNSGDMQDLVADAAKR